MVSDNDLTDLWTHSKYFVEKKQNTEVCVHNCVENDIFSFIFLLHYSQQFP